MRTFKIIVVFWGMLIGFCALSWLALAATPSTEAVISKSDGLHVGGAATDRIGFYNASPTVKPIITRTSPAAADIIAALAAQGLLATATPTPTPSATFTPTPTPTP